MLGLAQLQRFAKPAALEFLPPKGPEKGTEGIYEVKMMRLKTQFADSDNSNAK